VYINDRLCDTGNTHRIQHVAEAGKAGVRAPVQAEPGGIPATELLFLRPPIPDRREACAQGGLPGRGTSSGALQSRTRHDRAPGPWRASIGTELSQSDAALPLLSCAMNCHHIVLYGEPKRELSESDSELAPC